MTAGVEVTLGAAELELAPGSADEVGGGVAFVAEGTPYGVPAGFLSFLLLLGHTRF
jgi:hypothetical protein